MSNRYKDSDNGVPKMKTLTRDFFIHKFQTEHGKLDADAAAEFFGVASRTVYNWWRHGCPPWVDRFVEMALRSIPKTKDWEDFYFGWDNRLHTPYKDFSFSGDDILHVWWERDELRDNRRDVRTLTSQLNAFRNNAERDAIRDELNTLQNALEKLKYSPMLAIGRYHEPVAKRDKKGAKK